MAKGGGEMGEWKAHIMATYGSLFPEGRLPLSVGPGWRDLVEDLLAVIYGKRKRWQDVVEIRESLLAEGEELTGRYGWVVDYFEENPTDPLEGFKVVQVKEKFGDLRFYVEGGEGTFDGVIALAEMVSARTCIQCGAPARSMLLPSGWPRTLCPEHAEEVGAVSSEEWHEEE